MSYYINEIPMAVKRRLPHYLRVLKDLKKLNIERISSGQLSEILGYTASQIRQDLNHFGGFGQQGYGYNVKDLASEITTILGIDRHHDLIIIGCGRLGQAMANYINSNEDAFNIIGLFDINPEIVGKKLLGKEVMHQNDIKAFLAEHPAELATLCISQESAQKVANMLVECGIKGILNFTATDLSLPDGVCVENVYISRYLQLLCYDVTHAQK